MISFVQHSAGTYSEVFHPVTIAQHTRQYGRITIAAAILYSCSERNAVADASYTYGIFAGSFEATQPRGQFVLHFTLVEEVFTDSPTMSACGINVENGGNAFLIQSQIIVDSIGRRNDFIIITINNERTGSFLCHLLLVREFFFQFFRSIFAQQIVMRAHVGKRFIHRNHRIEENLEIRTKLFRRMCSDCRSQMTSGGRSHDTNIIRIQIPYVSTVAYHFHGDFGIRDRESAVPFRHPVFKNDQCNSLFVEIWCPVIPFMIDRQAGVSPTRASYHRTPSCQFRCRKKNTKRRLFNIKWFWRTLCRGLQTC